MRSFPTVILDLPRQEYTCDSACSVETMKPLNLYKAQLGGGGGGKGGDARGGAKARERGKMGGVKPRSLSLAFTPWLPPP